MIIVLKNMSKFKTTFIVQTSFALHKMCTWKSVITISRLDFLVRKTIFYQTCISTATFYAYEFRYRISKVINEQLWRHECMIFLLHRFLCLCLTNYFNRYWPWKEQIGIIISMFDLKHFIISSHYSYWFNFLRNIVHYKNIPLLTY